MRIEVKDDYTLCFKEVYNTIILETEEGNQMGICMRDDGFEFFLKQHDSGEMKWYCAKGRVTKDFSTNERKQGLSDDKIKEALERCRDYD